MTIWHARRAAAVIAMVATAGLATTMPVGGVRADAPPACLAESRDHGRASPSRAVVAVLDGATLRLDDGKQLLSLVPSHHNHAVGEKIGIRLDVDHVVAFPRAEGADD